MASVRFQKQIHLDMLFEWLNQEPISLLGAAKYTRSDLIRLFFPDMPCAAAQEGQKEGKADAIVNALPEESRTFCGACCRIDEVFKNYLNFFFTAQREKSTFCRSLFLSLFDGEADPLAFMADKAAKALRRAGLIDLPASDVRLRALTSLLESAMDTLCGQLPDCSLPQEIIRRDIHEALPMGLAKVIASYAVYLDVSTFKNDRKRMEMQKQLAELLMMIWKIQPEDIAWQANISAGIQAFRSGHYPQAQRLFEEARHQLDEEDRRSNYATASYADLLSYEAHMLLDGSAGERSFSKAYQLIQEACRVCALNGSAVSAPRRFYESAFYQLFHPSEWVQNGGADPQKGFLPALKRAVEEGCIDAIVLLADLYLSGANGCGHLKDPSRGVQLLERGAALPGASEQERAKCELRLAEHYLQTSAEQQAERYYEKAARLGSYRAVVHLREKRFAPEQTPDVIIPLQASGKACLIHARKDCADRSSILSASLDDSWTQQRGDVCQLLLQRPQLLQAGQLLFVFLSDDEQANLQGALELLKLLNSTAYHQQEDARLALISRVDVLVLVKEDASRMMLDAAMNHLIKDVYFRVHLFDPDMMAANELLQRFPTFLPCIDAQGQIKKERWKHQKKNERCQRRIALLGTTRCTKAIVRQIAAVTYLEEYPTQLAVIGPDASHMEMELQEECPGLFDASGAAHITPQFLNCSLDMLPINRAGEGKDAELHALLHNANYFVVAGEQDMENIALAIKLRTGLIKARLPQGLQPLIAVYYRDHRTQWMASQISVGARAADRYHWTENYDLQLFGSDDAFRYHALLDDPLRKRALSIHQSYYGLKVDPDQERVALRDFYCRSYNCDSSLCMALGMIYHCFAMGAYHAQPQDYASAASDAALGEKYHAVLTRSGSETEKLVDKAARIEHARWNGWSLSRGWTHPSDNVLVAYMQMQNPRHHLEIGRLHPYIIGYDQLEQEWKRLNDLIATCQHSAKTLSDPRLSDRALSGSIPYFLGFEAQESQP